MPQLSPEESKFREIRKMEMELAKRKAAMGIDRPMEVSEHPVEEEEKVREFVPEMPVQTKEKAAEKENVFEVVTTAVKKAAIKQSNKKTDEEKKAEVMRDAKAIASMDEERKIQTLAALAWQKGVSYSIEVAKKLEDPYTLDLLHSHLANELHDKLVAAKKLDDI
jgi:hypothetical protein